LKRAIDVDDAIRIWDKQKANFVQVLDLQLEHVEHGKSRMRMPFRPQVTNAMGAVHGGAIVSLCDTAFYVALASIYGPMQWTTTASLATNFLAQARPGHDLVAHAVVLKPGKRIVYGEVHVYSGERLVAHTTISFINKETPSRG
jgi:acyl-CoA thioesterase